jgi:hypothetical protein
MRTEKLEVQAMEIRKSILGSKHPYILTSMANLRHSLIRGNEQRRKAGGASGEDNEVNTRLRAPKHPDQHGMFIL